MEANIAQNRFVSIGLERYSRRTLAQGARNFGSLLSRQSQPLGAQQEAAICAALRLVGQSFSREKLLFFRGKDKLFAAITARQALLNRCDRFHVVPC